MLDNGKLVIKTEKGEELICDVLFTFDSDETGKSYIAYTDNTKDEKGNVKVYANTYDKNGENLVLNPLTSDKEWKIIDNILASVIDMVKEKTDEANASAAGGKDE